MTIEKKFSIKIEKEELKTILVDYIRNKHNLVVDSVYFNIQTEYITDDIYGDTSLKEVECSGSISEKVTKNA